MKNQMKRTSKKQQQGSLLWLKVLLPLLILIIVGFMYWTIEVSSDPNASRHQMADGVAKFYATFRQSFAPGQEKLDDYTIKLPEPEQSLTAQLQQRQDKVQPADRNWRGEAKRRSFKENDTIRSALSSFAEEEGMELIWNLKYDYIIKHHFVERVNLKQLINKVATTVNNDYDGQVKTYFCPQERALIVTVEEEQYVTEFCDSAVSRQKQLYEKRKEEDYKLKKRLGLL